MGFCFHAEDISFDFEGPFNSTQNTLLKLRRHLDVVTLHMPLVIGDPNQNATTQALSVNPIPEEYRPSVEVNFPVSIISDDIYQDIAGELRIRTNGMIEVSCRLGNNTAFGVNDRNGWKSVCISYIAN